MIRFATCALSLLLIGSLGACSGGEGGKTSDHAGSAAHDGSAMNGGAPAASDSSAEDAILAAQLPSYPAMACPVTGEVLGSMGEPANYVSHGRLVRFCCSGCEKKFESSPATYFATIDAAITAEQVPRYPLDTCPIDGAKLGSRGEPVDHVDGTKLVRFCRSACRDEYVRDPGDTMQKVNAGWITAQLADYPTNICPVMEIENDALDEAFDVLHGTRLIRFCCESCAEEFQEDPAKFLAKLDELS